MNKGNRPAGRKKKVAGGTAGVFRRGDAVQTGGKPAGKAGGYADRKTQKTKTSFGGTASSGDRQQNSDLLGGVIGAAMAAASSGKPARSGGGSALNKIIIVAIIVFVGYWLISSFFGNPAAEPVSGEQDFPEVTAGETPEANLSVSGEANPKRTVIKGNGGDEFTVMIFMCGTDLESKNGMATADLKEILGADIGDKVNIIVETGGTSAWQVKGISSSVNQRWQCTEEGLELLRDDLGARSMTDPATLTDFIKFCKTNYPANRNALIFWDHGGGSLSGYGYDQKFPGTSMTLDKIDTALKNAGCVFDFIGFDACLMATLENALMLSDYADYMLASEETEPGIGWYYTGWITRLSADTSMSTVEIGKNIIDDFMARCAASNPRDKTTLSLVDLAELSGTFPGVFRSFSSSAGEMIDNDQYKTVSDARGNTREFGQSVQIDQIDLIHFAGNIGTDEADAMAAVLKQSIKYNRSSISNANGLSIYFPYDKLSGVNRMLSTYDKIGMDDEYSSCIKSFASLEAGGQIVTSGAPNPLQSLMGSAGGNTGAGMISGLLGSFLGGGDFSSLLGAAAQGGSWLDADRILDSADYYEENYLDSANIVFTEKDGGQVLSLSEQEWSLVQSVGLNVFVDDGSGFIDLGIDNVFEFDADGDLIIGFDGTWLTLDGHVVSYYFLTEDITGDSSVITGRIPALLNDLPVDIILVFDDENPYGAVAGARIRYEGETDTVAKGLLEIKEGDVIDFLCDYYTYDGDYDASFKLGDRLVADELLEVANMQIGDSDCRVTYLLTDIYNNTYWTPSVSY